MVRNLDSMIESRPQPRELEDMHTEKDAQRTVGLLFLEGQSIADIAIRHLVSRRAVEAMLRGALLYLLDSKAQPQCASCKTPVPPDWTCPDCVTMLTRSGQLEPETETTA